MAVFLIMVGRRRAWRSLQIVGLQVLLWLSALSALPILGL